MTGKAVCFVFQRDRFIAARDLLPARRVLMGRRLTVRVSVGSPCNNREKSAQRGF